MARLPKYYKIVTDHSKLSYHFEDIFTEMMPYDDEFGTICVCAVRYSLGRRTYMPKLVMDYIRKMLPHVDDNALGVIIRDIGGCDYLGDSCDELEWKNFRQQLLTQQQRRNA